MSLQLSCKRCISICSACICIDACQAESLLSPTRARAHTQACLSSSVGIAYISTDGTVQEANQAFGDLLGMCGLSCPLAERSVIAARAAQSGGA